MKIHAYAEKRAHGRSDKLTGGVSSVIDIGFSVIAFVVRSRWLQWLRPVRSVGAIFEAKS